ncbi:MAG: dihydrodipicolinate synthase family protein [Chloroflexota bacterium]|nr:dihydrodipicolinate synthase family protein [Chloroflexota bacterium]
MAEYSKTEAMDWARENLRGQWSTLMTPFTEADEIDEEGLRRDIRHVKALGTKGAGCTWGMGEFWTLTKEERLKVYDIVSDEAGSDWAIGAHVSHTSMKEMLDLASYSEHAGFDLLIVAAPYFATRTEDQVIEWVSKLAENTNLAIMYYNSPQFGTVLDANGLDRVCDIPNIVGVKEASFNPELSVDTHLKVGTKAIISTPDEWIFHKGKELGFEQQVMFANTSDWRFDTPDANYYVQYIDKVMQGDLDNDFYDSNVKPIKEVSDKWWEYTVQKMGGALPASLCKYWGELMGMSGGHVRAPLTDLTDDEKQQLRDDIAAVANT